MEVKTMIDELNLDESEETTQLVANLIEQAGAIIRSSVDNSKPVELYEQEPIYERAVATLVTQLYYDRSLDAGLSNGLQMMINHLKGRVVVDG